MKNKYLFFLSLVAAFYSNFSQNGWTWTELSTMPKRISNNAVVESTVNGEDFVYSFCGIDSTKGHAGINLQSFKYTVATDTWQQIADVPDTMGKIAAAASYVNGKIYILGGYHVRANSSEVSSNKVHIYNPVSDAFETDGTPIPVPIDDHVQCVYKDSLIFVITGWSNTGNVPNVQIYDTYNDSWQVGSATPNNTIYTAFGASGVIIGDTIIYNGGVRGGSFVTVNRTRIGVIDANDPTQITWSVGTPNPGAKGYRSACSSYNNRAFWIGGAGVAYNFDGIAYSGGAGVEPLTRILQYDNGAAVWDEGLGAPYGIMDLRGVAKVGATSWIIAGGMEMGQQVTNRSFLLEFDPVVLQVSDSKERKILIYPNPVRDKLYISNVEQNAEYQILSISGQIIKTGKLIGGIINVTALKKGAYLLKLFEVQVQKFVIIE